MSAYKLMLFVIPVKAGIQNILKALDSGLKTAGMTENPSNFINRTINPAFYRSLAMASSILSRPVLIASMDVAYESLI